MPEVFTAVRDEAAAAQAVQRAGVVGGGCCQARGGPGRSARAPQVSRGAIQMRRA